MTHNEPRSDFWSLNSEALAEQCSLIAHSDPAAIDDRTRAEAGQLFEEWEEAIHMPEVEFEDKERRAAQLAALRKRTIEILVRVSLRQEEG